MRVLMRFMEEYCEREGILKQVSNVGDCCTSVKCILNEVDGIELLNDKYCGPMKKRLLHSDPVLCRTSHVSASFHG